MRKLIFALAGTALMAVSGASHAGLVLDNTGVVGAGALPVSGTIAGTNDLGFTGSVLYGQLTSTGGYVQFEYLGKEAGYTNTFDMAMGGLNLFTTGVTAPGAVSSWYAVGPGVIDFSLCTSGGDSEPTYGRCLYNANAASMIAQYNLGGVGSGYRSLGFREEEGGSWLIFWDDSGANNDDDYDDLVARIRFTVPEPATLGMLGLGLLGLGFGARRRRS